MGRGRTGKKRGPPKRDYSRQKGHSGFLHFKNARELVRAELIPSIAAYDSWWKINRPKIVPRRPDRIYAGKGWISWNDFLGTNNKFGTVKRNWMPFEEARQYVRTLKLETYQQWVEYTKTGQLPDGIPHNPVYVYEEWFSWKDWLGTNIKQLVKEAAKIVPVLYIIKFPNNPSNVYRINVTNNKRDIINFIDSGAQLVMTFENNPNVDWRKLLSAFGKSYNYGDADDYLINNIHGFIFELDNVLTQYKL
jgi:hypothetical protein